MVSNYLPDTQKFPLFPIRIFTVSLDLMEKQWTSVLASDDPNSPFRNMLAVTLFANFSPARLVRFSISISNHCNSLLIAVQLDVPV